jgi:hypothetical protein
LHVEEEVVVWGNGRTEAEASAGLTRATEARGDGDERVDDAGFDRLDACVVEHGDGERWLVRARLGNRHPDVDAPAARAPTNRYETRTATLTAHKPAR